jgi:hypothetical protein
MQYASFYQISVSPIIGISTAFRQAQNFNPPPNFGGLILEIINVWMTVPMGFSLGWLKLSPSSLKVRDLRLELEQKYAFFKDLVSRALTVWCYG